MIFNNRNKIGRFLNSHVKSHDTRTGQCNPGECETLDGQKGAACCKLGIICPSLSGTNCCAYDTRPRNCIVFPHIPQDLNLVKNCGYSFDTSTEKRALNGFNIKKMKNKLYKQTPEVMLFGLGSTDQDDQLHIDEVSVNIKRSYQFDKKILRSPDVVDFLMAVYQAIDLYEEFLAVYLNRSNKIIGVARISSGGVSGTVADIKIILGIAVKTGASSIILSHNHPSGEPRPSDADIKLTDKIKTAAMFHEIQILDHLIISSKDYYSFADSGDLSLHGFDTITIDTEVKTKPQTNKTHHMKKMTKENFSEVLSTIDQSEFTDVIKETITELKTLTSNFTDWSLIDSDKDLADIPLSVIDYVNKQLSKQDAPVVLPQPPATVEKKKPSPAPKAKAEKKPKAIKEEKEKPVKPAYTGEMVENVMPEVRIIKRYVALHDKKTTADKILSFIDTLQRMIRSQAIRKTSKYASEINHIQKELLKIYKDHRGSRAQFPVELTKTDIKVLEAYRAIAQSQKPMQSIRLIKQYIAIQGKTDVKEKAKTILAEINKYVNTGEKYSYQDELNDIHNSLKSYLEGKTDVPEISEQRLNGFQGLGLIDFNHDITEGDLVRTFDSKKGRVTGVKDKSIQIDTNPGHYYAKTKVRLLEKAEKPCACVGAACLSGLGEVATMNSTEFAKEKFKTVGFTGKWAQLIGDPSEPFKLMVWSKPGKGKSSLMIEFAKYMASQHKRTVLYCANEEGLNHTLQEKFTRMDAFDPLITISQSLPLNLGLYNYVFIDSVTSFKLSIKDLEDLIKTYPATCFMFIYQSTVDGGYRGNKEVEHLVDVSIYINELGYATAQKTRFGGKGTVNVFPDDDPSKIYKFTTLQDAEKFVFKLESTLDSAMVQGDDGKIWVTDKAKAQELSELGFAKIE